MATIHPENINLCRSPAEKRILEYLKKFSDKFQIIQNLPWISTYVMDLTKHFSPEGEADFIIFHEEYGILVLEVKGGNISYNRHAYFTNEKQLKEDPHVQSRKSAHFLRNNLKDLSNEILLGYAVIFPDSRKPPYKDSRKEITFDIYDLENLEVKILEAFEFWKDCYKKKNIVVSSIKKNINLILDTLIPTSIIDPLNHKIEFDNKNWLILSETQKDLLRKLSKNRRFFISGRAGTGKTILAIILSRLLQQEKVKVLFLTFNVELSQMIYEELKDNEYITSLRFHQYLRQFASNIDKEDSLNNEKEILEYLIKVNKNEFDVLIIDEAQSFATIWLNLLSIYFKDKKVYIFSDELQSFSNEGNITNLQMKKIFNFDDEVILSINYRSPFKVYKRLLEIFDSSIQQTTPRTLDNLDLKEIITDNPRKSVEDNIDNLLYRGIKKEDIVILIPSSEGRNIKSYEYNNIKIQTVQKYRGMERPIVIFILGSLSKKDFNELYVAYSRSTTQTIVIIPERLLSFGKTKFEQILLESDLTDDNIKKNIDTSVDKFYNQLISNYKTINFLDNPLYYSSKYFLLDIQRERFINNLLEDYLKEIDLPYIYMDSWDVKSGRFYSTVLLKEEQNHLKILNYYYCNKCNTETYGTFDFCLNCNLENLNDIKLDELIELKILNNYKDYSKEERYSINYSLKIIGRYYYSGLYKNLTKNVMSLLNNQSRSIYLGAMIDLLILIYTNFREHNKIRITEIQEINTKLFDLEDKKEINAKAGILVNMFIKQNIFKKEDKGVYSFSWLDIFIK